MKKEMAIALKNKALEVAKTFSNPERLMNKTGETFELFEIVPLSESTASVTFKKNTDKYSVAFFYYLNGNGGYWCYFFPTYDHLEGLNQIRNILHEIEQKNFPMNFK